MKKYLSIMAIVLTVLLSLSTVAAAAQASVNVGDLISLGEAKWQLNVLADPSMVSQYVFDANGKTILMNDGCIKAAFPKNSEDFNNYTVIESNDIRFDLKADWPDGVGDWLGFVTFRDNCPGVPIWETANDPNRTRYALGIMKDVIGIKKYNSAGEKNLDGGEYKVSVDGENHSYRILIEDTDSAVLIKVFMDGKLIIDTKDDSQTRITKNAGLMFMGHTIAGRTLKFGACTYEYDAAADNSSSENTTTDATTDNTTTDTAATDNNTAETATDTAPATDNTTAETATTDSTDDTAAVENTATEETDQSTDNPKTGDAAAISLVAVVIGSGLVGLKVSRNKK